MLLSTCPAVQVRCFASQQHPTPHHLSRAFDSAASRSSSRHLSDCKDIVRTRIRRSRLPAVAACRLASWQPAVHASFPCSSSRSANASHPCAATPTSGSSAENTPASDGEAAASPPAADFSGAAKESSADASSESSPATSSTGTAGKDEVELLPGTVYDVEELRGVRVNVDENQSPLVEYLVKWKVHSL